MKNMKLTRRALVYSVHSFLVNSVDEMVQLIVKEPSTNQLTNTVDFGLVGSMTFIKKGEREEVVFLCKKDEDYYIKLEVDSYLKKELEREEYSRFFSLF